MDKSGTTGSDERMGENPEMARSQPAKQAKGGENRSEVEGHTSMETTGRRLVYYAAERTLLTWIRVALTLMGLGFVIDRFSLVYEQSFLIGNLRLMGRSIPSWAGTIMVVLGTLMSVVAAISYLRVDERCRQGDTTPGRGLVFGVILALIVAILGMVIALFLFTVPM